MATNLADPEGAVVDARKRTIKETDFVHSRATDALEHFIIFLFYGLIFKIGIGGLVKRRLDPLQSALQFCQAGLYFWCPFVVSRVQILKIRVS